jgi:5'-nucleotidase
VKTPIALIDLDDTLCDHTSALLRDLNEIAAPGESSPRRHDPEEPDYIRLRKQLIRRQPDWWYSLPPYKPGFEILHLLWEFNFEVHVLTKGPWTTADAWAQKVRWCREHLGHSIKITITSDKSLVYGKVLVDDYPDYVVRWLRWRPRGLAIMPAHPHNESFSHPNVVRYDSENLLELRQRLSDFRDSLYKKDEENADS